MAEERGRRRHAAILAADVVGYSQLMGEDEVGTRKRSDIEEHNLQNVQISPYQGRQE